MVRKLIFYLLFLLTIVSPGRVKFENFENVTKQDLYEFRAHIYGGIWTVETNFGGYGDPNFSSTGNPSFDYPGGFGYAYLWEG